MYLRGGGIKIKQKNQYLTYASDKKTYRNIIMINYKENKHET